MPLIIAILTGFGAVGLAVYAVLTKSLLLGFIALMLGMICMTIMESRGPRS